MAGLVVDEITGADAVLGAQVAEAALAVLHLFAERLEDLALVFLDRPLRLVQAVGDLMVGQTSVEQRQCLLEW